MTAWATMATATSLRPCSSPSPTGPLKRALAIGEQRHGGRRRQGEPRPGSEAAKVSGAHEPDREAGLAAGRTRQKLAERNQIGIGALVEPAAPDDELTAEIAEMRDRPAETGQAELEKDTQDLERGARAASSKRGSSIADVIGRAYA